MKNNLFLQFISLLFILSFNYSFGQAFDKTKELMRSAKIPNSPEAQAFSAYGNIDVGLYTGTPNVGVPLYTHVGKELNLPLSLSYDASGIKVEQEATGAGLGWNLNGNGRISRIANGLPDDFYTGGVNTGTWIAYETHWDNNIRASILQYLNDQYHFDTEAEALAYLEFLRKMNDNECDALPDFFSFNALGINDMFVIDVNTREARALNNPRIKVECHKTFNSGNGSISKWTVTLDDGTILKFDQYIDSNGVIQKAKEITFKQRDNDVSSEALNAMSLKYNSSWLLTDVISPTAKDRYKFVYHKFPLTQIYSGLSLVTSVVNYTHNPNSSPTGNPNFNSLSAVAGTNIAEISREELFLAKILYNYGGTNGSDYREVVNITLKDRDDYVNNSAIDKIEIFNPNGALNKAYKFNHTYFNDDSNSAPIAYLRLKLDSIDIFNSANQKVSDYIFEYDSPLDLPSKRSYAQDYYGYYNGKSNTVLYPTTTKSQYIGDGADRSVSFGNAKIGTLNKITYPTGGYTLFNYGPNKSTHVSPSQQQSITQFNQLINVSMEGGLLCGGTNFYCSDSECETQDCVGSYSEVGADGAPKFSHDVFYVPESGDYLYSTTQNNLFGTAGLIPMQRVILFKRTDIDSENPNLSPNPYRVDELFRFSQPDNTEIVQMANNFSYLNNSSDSYNYNENAINLEQGYYQLTMVNPQEGIHTSFVLGQYQTTNINSDGEETQIIKAGIRIQSIKDYTKDGEIALEKKYTYGNGTVISEPFYEYLVTNYTVEDYWGGDDNVPPMLYRSTHASGTDKPHIGYRTVTETITDFNEDETGFTADTNNKTEFNSAGWGSHRTGVYTYYINGKETASNYSVIYGLGKPKQVKSHGYYTSENVNIEGYGEKYINTYEYDHSDFYSNSGVYPRVIESRSHLYACPQQNPDGGWFIGHLAPRLFSSLDSSVLLGEITGGSSGVANGIPSVFFEGGGSDDSGGGDLGYGPPLECNGISPDLCSTALGRIELQVARAFGRIGYLKESKKNERQARLEEDGLELDDISLVEKENYTYYDNEDNGPLNFLLKSSTTLKSNGRIVSQEFLYPENFSSIDNGTIGTDEYNDLIDKNMVNIPVQINTYEGVDGNTSLISRKKTEYNTQELPSKIKIAKGDDDFEDRLLLEVYDDKNLVQAREPNGIPATYVWGYNKKHIVAKIENATYADVEALSDFGANFSISQALNQDQENALRSLPNTLVTTYSYEPLVGVTSMTDPRGNTVYYEYDDYHRLKHVKDRDGNILSKNEYNFRTQN